MSCQLNYTLNQAAISIRSLKYMKVIHPFRKGKDFAYTLVLNSLLRFLSQTKKYIYTAEWALANEN